MRRDDADYQRVRRCLDTGNYGWLDFDFKWVKDMTDEEELDRFTRFRQQCRLLLPGVIDGWHDVFPYDKTEAQAMREDLALRKRQPIEGLWFDDSLCQMCGIETDRMVWDHCHFTGLARGRLCQRCNQREGLDDDPRWRCWRLCAPFLKRGSRWIYKTECGDCPRETLMETPWPVLLDFHRWVQAENHNMLRNQTYLSWEKIP